MEPGEFRQRVEDLCRQADDSGLHRAHIENNLEAVLAEWSDDGR